MKQLLLTFSLIFVLINLSGQQFRDKFFELINKNDTVAAEKLIKEWVVKKPNDPEIYVAYFNFFGKKAMTNVLRIGDNPEGKEALTILDKDTTKKGPVGYIYDDNLYNSKMLDLGFAYIDTGIMKYPNRLDMRFGKIFMLGEIKDYTNFSNEIIKAVDYSNVIKNKWLWTNNEPVKEPQNFLLGNIQTYVVQIFNVGDEQLENIKKIAVAILKYYPNHAESLSNLAITYQLKKDFDNALIQLLKAEKYAPQDFIVLINIANCYREKGDKANAVKYYESVVKYGDEDAKEFAKQEIKELKK